MNHRQFIYPPPPPRRVSASYLSPLRFLFLLIAAAVMLTGCPSPSEDNPPSTTTTGGGGTAPEGGGGTPDGGTKPGSGAAVRTLSFNLELSEPNGSPLALGSGPSLTSVTSDKGNCGYWYGERENLPCYGAQCPAGRQGNHPDSQKTRLRRY